MFKYIYVNVKSSKHFDNGNKKKTEMKSIAIYSGNGNAMDVRFSAFTFIEVRLVWMDTAPTYRSPMTE